MARHKNTQWNLPETASLEYAKLGVLMDIRDELQALNRLLACPNFIAIPGILRTVADNTKRKPCTKKSK